MMMRRTLALALVVAALGAAVACSGGEQEAAAPADAQRRTVLVGDSMSYDPAALTVQAGKPVLLTVRNTGNTDHDLVFQALPARDVTTTGQSAHNHGAGTIAGHPKLKSEVTVGFTPTTPGEYVFFCTLPGHRQLGMIGALTVE
jgi:uncharacterized cupredoxin-like copper-binding protein